MTESQLVLLYNPWSQTPYLSTTLSQFVTNITCSTCPGATTINLFATSTHLVMIDKVKLSVSDSIN